MPQLFGGERPHGRITALERYAVLGIESVEQIAPNVVLHILHEVVDARTVEVEQHDLPVVGDVNVARMKIAMADAHRNVSIAQLEQRVLEPRRNQRIIAQVVRTVVTELEQRRHVDFEFDDLIAGQRFVGIPLETEQMHPCERRADLLGDRHAQTIAEFASRRPFVERDRARPFGRFDLEIETAVARVHARRRGETARFEKFEEVQLVRDDVDRPPGLAPHPQRLPTIARLDDVDVVHAAVEQKGLHGPCDVIAPLHFTREIVGLEHRMRHRRDLMDRARGGRGHS